MTTERLYLTDPLTTEFEGEIINRLTLPDGRHAVILPRTYFYPTGGGQDHDTGMLDDVRVVDVLSDEQGQVLHIVERDLPIGRVHAAIDRDRRLAFMQLHSAQHLLSSAVEQVVGLETIAVHISIQSLSTIDFPTPSIGDRGLIQAEQLANRVIFEDRPIKSYFVPSAEIGSVPLRRPPKVEGMVRIVEIDHFDYSACGGTHCLRTGMIGMVKVLKAERRGQETRIYFVAGAPAWQLFHDEHAALVRLSQRLNSNPETALAALDKQIEQTTALEKQVKALQGQKLVLEGEQLAATAERIGNIRFRVALYDERPQVELRQLGSRLQNEPGLVAVLASHDGARVALVVSAAPDTGTSANELIKVLLAPIGGKGGGDARLAQGGGSATTDQFQQLPRRARELFG